MNKAGQSVMFVVVAVAIISVIAAAAFLTLRRVFHVVVGVVILGLKLFVPLLIVGVIAWWFLGRGKRG